MPCAAAHPKAFAGWLRDLPSASVPCLLGGIPTLAVMDIMSAG
jgi:hypothetical protein